MPKQFNWTLTIAVIAIIFSAFALYNKDSGSAVTRDTMEKMKKTGKVDVCYVVWSPAVIKDPNTGELSGHMIDTLDIIWDEANVEPVYHEQSWGTAVLGINSGICDIVASGFFINITRAYNVGFTKPLFYASDVALVRKGETRFSTVYDADKAGINITVANGESGHNFVENNFEKANIHILDIEGGDMSRLGLEVSSGRADMVIVGAGNLEEYAKSNPGVEIIFTDKPFHLNPTAWAVRQDDQKFLNFLQNAVETLEANGQINALEKKYNAPWSHEIKNYGPIN